MPNLTFAILSAALMVIFLLLAYAHKVVFGDIRQTMNAAVSALEERGDSGSVKTETGKGVDLKKRRGQASLHYGYFAFVAAAIVAAIQSATFTLEYLGIHVLL